MPSIAHFAREISAGGPFALIGRLMRDDLPAVEGALVVEGGKIAAIDSPVVMARLPALRIEAAYLAPGFVDLQVNGAFGFEVGADPDALRALCAALPRTGVTSFLPTVISSREEHYREAFAAFDAVRTRPPPPGSARIEGFHLEGPFLSPARAGAHPVAEIEDSDVGLMERIADPAWVRLVTLAPEREGALELIARLGARGVNVSLGHTDATFETFTAGVDAGARLATHVFNAMSPLHHRHPGAAAAALTDDRVTALLIADGVHTHPAILRLAWRAKGPERLGLVTDAIAGAGLSPGTSSRLAGRPLIVDQHSARLADGRLAGSTLTLDQAVRNAVAFADLEPTTAIRLASRVPARAIELSHRGRLVTGADADIVLLDHELQVLATLVGGHLGYDRASALSSP